MKLRDKIPVHKAQSAHAGVSYGGGEAELGHAALPEGAVAFEEPALGPRAKTFYRTLRSVPSSVRETVERFLAEHERFRSGASNVRPPKQLQIAIPDVPRLSLIVYASGECAWRSRFVDPLTGRPTCVVLGRIGQMSMAQAIAEHFKVMSDVAEGRSPCARKMTLNCAVEMVFEAARKRGKKSVRDDMSRWRTHLQPRLGHLKLCELTPGLLEREARAVRAGTNPATADRIVALIRAICRDLVELGLLTVNPATHLKITNAVSPRTTMATPEQLSLLGAVMAPSPEMMHEYFQLLMVTGLRAGEARTVKFGDIDFERKTLLLRETKSGVPQTVPLSPDAIKILKRRRAARTTSDFVFPGKRDDRPMSHPHKAFQALQRRAGVSGLHLHALRRGFATAGIQAEGVTVHDISKLLRHSRTAVTEAHYLVADDGRLRKAANEASKTIMQRLGLDRQESGLRPTVSSVLIDQNVGYIVLARAA